MSLYHDSAPIFSPSIARKNASSARDWAYIEAWLVNKLSLANTSSLPAFERNSETLEALLTLAAHNEAADEQRALLYKAEAMAYQEVKDAQETEIQNRLNGRGLREDLLHAIEEELPKDGRSALDGMANMAASAGMAFPGPQALGRKLVGMQSEIAEMKQMLARAEILDRHIQAETVKATKTLQQLSSDAFEPPIEIAKHNLTAQRQGKAVKARTPRMQDRIAASKPPKDLPHPTIEDVVAAEGKYTALLLEKRELDARLASFQGLPTDMDQARSEVDALRHQLQDITSRRDAVFEGLVERESPVKPRRR